MKKSTMRSLGLGFLASGLLVAGYGIFLKDSLPVAGVGIDQMLPSQSSSTSATRTEDGEGKDSGGASQESLLALNESLTSDNASLSRQIQELQDQTQSLTSQLRSQSSSQTSQARGSESDTDSQDDQNNPSTESRTFQGSQAENSTPATQSSERASTFTIPSGASSAEIAQSLEEAGYIPDAEEFQALIDQWGLETHIGAGDYELNTDMSIHDIASIITQGAYYYY